MIKNTSSQFENIPPPQQSTLCSIHNKPIHKICTQDFQFICPQCEQDHQEHVVKSLAFVAEEISETLRVKMVPNEKIIESFTLTLKESQDKFKKSNLKQTLSVLLEMIKSIVRQFDRSQVLDDCVSLIEGFKSKVEIVNSMRKKIKQGDRQCLEVIRQQKEIEETVTDIQKERTLVEISMTELKQINSEDLNLNLGEQSHQDLLRERLLFSFIELIKEKNTPMASLLIPQGLKRLFERELGLSNNNDKENESLILNSQSINQPNMNSNNNGSNNQGSFNFSSNGSGIQNLNNDPMSPSNRSSSSYSNPFEKIENQPSQQLQQQRQKKIDQAFQMTEICLKQAHNDFINQVLDFNQDYYVTCASDFTVNLWSKETFQLIENFDLEHEVVSMCKASLDTLICGCINGVVGIIDIGTLRIQSIIKKAHTGTVISCLALNKLNREYVITQDDSREMRVWKMSDLTQPIIKTIGRSYNPVWYVQSLIEVEFEGMKDPVILQACGNEPKVVQYRVDVNRQQLEQLGHANLKGIPTAIIQVTPQFYACASTTEIEFFDVMSNENVNTIHTTLPTQANQMSYSSNDNLMTLTTHPIQGDPGKRYLAATGSNRMILIYKVDTMLKCRSMLIYSFQTSHSNAINNMAFLKTKEPNVSYLITASIDKKQGIFKIDLPITNSQIQEQNNQSQSDQYSNSKLTSSNRKLMSKMDSMNKGQGIKSSSSSLQQNNAKSEEKEYKFLNEYLNQNQQNRGGPADKNNPACCYIF
eukprot:403344062